MEHYAVFFALVCAIAAIVYGLISARWILGLPQGNERMQQIAAASPGGSRGLHETPVLRLLPLSVWQSF